MNTGHHGDSRTLTDAERKASLDHDAMDAHPHRCLSALADGERDAEQQACALWRDDPRARQDWHLYHLIGDVLRSDELASRPGRDAAFVASLREKLAREPVPLAPSPSIAAVSERSRLGWRAPAAVAAGFAVVAGVLVMTHGGPSADPAAGPVLASTRSPSAVAPVTVSASGTGAPVLAGSPPQYVLDGRLIRDARLEGYLRAHQAARGGAPAALPGGALRSVEVIVPVQDAAR